MKTRSRPQQASGGGYHASRPRARAGLYSRLLKGGLPTLLSSGVVAVVPLSGALFLATEEYAIWALISTLSTMFVIFDFGAVSFATKVAAEGRLGRLVLIKLIAITSAPPLLLSMLAVIVWPYYAIASGLGAGEDQRVAMLIIAVGVGTTFRSIGVVLAAMSLGRERFRQRGLILISGAVVQALATVGCLAGGIGYWSLGVGVVSGGGVQLVVGFWVERCDVSRGADTPIGPTLKRFVSAKGLASLFGMTATQLDRWALGLVANAEVLASYDIVTRFATMPKIALISVAAGLVAESARAKNSQDIQVILKKAQRLNVPLAVSSAFVVVPLSLAMIGERVPPEMSISIVVVVVAAHVSNSLTIPAALLLTGMGRPGYEILYLAPLAALCLASYTVAIMLDVWWILLLGWAVAMVASSWYFTLSGPRFIRKAGYDVK